MTNQNILILLHSTLSMGEHIKPFTNSEMSKIIEKLEEKNLELKDLSGLDKNEIYAVFFDNSESDDKKQSFINRLSNNMSRQGSIVFDLMEIKKWGIEMITVYDDKYPKVFKSKLGNKAPHLLYYCGNIDLIDQKQFIGFSGSRLKNVSGDDESITRSWSKKFVENEFGVVSGGASGIDSFAVQEAIRNNGYFIEFLSDSMIKRLKIVEIAKALQNGKGLILSETNPYASFNVGMAMSRNKYIYLLSNKLIIIRAEYTLKGKVKSGGTWNGAIENLKNNYTDAFVIENSTCDGNNELIELGYIPITLPDNSYEVMFNQAYKKNNHTNSIQEISEIEKEMVKILKQQDFIENIKLTNKQLENRDSILKAISKVNTTFSELKIDKNIYKKIYDYCYDKSIKKEFIQLTLFD